MIQITSMQIVGLPVGRRLFMTVRAPQVKTYAFSFVDLMDFDEVLRLSIADAARLVPANAITSGVDRELMQLEGLYIEDASLSQKRVIPGAEVAERRASGEHVAGGRWYMEVLMNGTATDCSFDSLEELIQITQSIIRREARVAVIRPDMLVAGAH